MMAAKSRPRHAASSDSDAAQAASSAAAVTSRFSDPTSGAAAQQSAQDDPPSAPPQQREAAGAESSTVQMDRRGDHSAVCRWSVSGFPRVKARALWSRYFDVGGYDCRLLVYPKGDSQALPGYFSIYLQILDPRAGSSSSSSHKWDCFASYRLSVLHPLDDSKSIHRDSWHRFSAKKKSHGWCDFAPISTVLDPKSGFLSSAAAADSLLVSADILILHESVSFSRDPAEAALQHSHSSSSFSSSASAAASTSSPDVLSGKFTWKVHNFSLFKEMIKAQKIMSPVFPAGECNLRISVYQSSVSGVDYLSMCLESKDTEKSVVPAERSCWCLFRMSVLNQKPGLNHIHRDSYGRFAADNKNGDNTSLGWNDYMKMSDFLGVDTGFLLDDTATFTASFHVIKESNSFSKNAGLLLGSRSAAAGARKSDGHLGRFTWRIDNFTKLKDLLKKRKITGLCVKSRRFQIGNRDCRLIVYPRGQSQPPCYLSVFLEVTDSRNTNSDWSCFVSHRLSVVNQKMEEKSVTKESQNRYSKAAKDWGWREFVTLTSLFDQDAGFLVQDTVVFSAEVLILKEAFVAQDFHNQYADLVNAGSQIDVTDKKSSFTWKVENFLAFKEIMESRKIFSKFFQAGGCELRIGVYESFDTICIYLESDQSAGSEPDRNYWVRYRMAVVNQKNPGKTIWKESSICTKTWNNSVLQFMKVSDMLEMDAGFLVRDTVVFVCEILDCCPWFEFSDLEVLASEDDQDALSTDPDELIDSEDSEGLSGDEEDIFRNLLARAGFHLTYGDNSSQPQVTLREKLLMDAGAIAGFLTGLRVYLDDPAKVKRLLLPTKLSGANSGKKESSKNDANSPSLMNLLMGVKVLQQAIIDLLLDIMVECCQPSEGDKVGNHFSPEVISSQPSIVESESTCPSVSSWHCVDSINQRLDASVNESISASAVQSSDLNRPSGKAVPGQPICPPETSATDLLVDDIVRASKTKWPEQSEELLGLIVNSLRALDGVVPHGCPEPRRRPQSAQKIALVLDKAPKHLQPDLVALVPKLVDQSEHQLAACALLDRLQKPDAEPSLQIPVLGALSQLEFGSDVWERVLLQAFRLLTDSKDEPLAASISFVFKAASQCQHVSKAVRVVRTRLQILGSHVSPSVLDVLTKTIHSSADVAEAWLKDIDSDIKPCLSPYLYSEDASFEGPHVLTDQIGCYMSDIFILIEMLSLPILAVETSRVFERAVSRGTFLDQSVAMILESVAMVLETRRSHKLQKNSANSSPESSEVTNGLNDNTIADQEDDFTPLLFLAEALALSRGSRVQEFVSMLYAILFKMFTEEHSRSRMLKGLVDRATSSTDNCHEVDLDLNILVFLVREEKEITRSVLSMMREVAELANVDRAALWHQLCACEDENMRLREERQTEVSNFSREKSVLSQRLSESEAINNRLKSDLKAEIDRFNREKKELGDQLHDIENQMEWIRSERDDEIAKLSAEKKLLQDRLHDAETQLLQLKSRKRDEFKRVVKEKNALAEKLKSAEATRKRFDEELKRYATETVSREEVRQSLEGEVRRLTQTVGQTEGEKREKEEQVTRCEAYIDAMEAKLQACEQYIKSLEAQYHEEMSRHAPLYGAGLEALSPKELETLARIHEEGLRQIHSLQQHKGNPSSLGVPHSLPPLVHNNHAHGHGLYSSHPLPHVAVGLPPSIAPTNGVSIHGNGHVNGSSVGPWFNPT